METVENRHFAPGFRIVAIVSLVMAVLACALWVFQDVSGLQNTNTRNTAMWGLYMMNFMFLIGIGTGCALVAALPLAAGSKVTLPVAKMAAWAGIVACAVGAVFVVVDLGQPLRVLGMVMRGNIASPLMWDFVSIPLFLVVMVVFLVMLRRAEQDRPVAGSLRLWAVLAVVASVLLLSVDAWIFSLQVAHEVWNTALLAPWFIASAVAGGAGLVLLVAAALRKSGVVAFDAAARTFIAKIMGVALLVDVYCYVCDLVTAAYGGGIEGAQIASMLVAGPLAPFFWAQMVCAVVALVIAFMAKLRDGKALMVAAALAVIAVFLKRVQLIVGGFQLPNVDASSYASSIALADAGRAVQGMFPGLAYVPSPLEMGLAVCMLDLGVFVFLVGLGLVKDRQQ